MKILKTFEDFSSLDSSDDEIRNYIEEMYHEDWFNEQLSERVYDYVSEEDVEEAGLESYEDYYQEYSHGGAIEYDLLDLMNKDVMSKFGVDYDKASELCEEQFIKACSWKDPLLSWGGNSKPKKDLNDDYNRLKNAFDDLDTDSSGVKL